MRKLYTIVLCTLAIFIQSCTEKNPQSIIDKAISSAGGEKYLHSTIEFDFRGRHYVGSREGGKFSYERIFKNEKDSTQSIRDIVSNDGFKRFINDSLTTVPDSMAVKYTSSVNSVHYFALLPYGLNDDSVKKKFLGETTIDNKTYYKIEITFNQEGGGEDHDDQFIYWINTSDHTIGFLAYSYAEDDGIGYRLRKAYNSRKVNGILFSDYINYAPNGKIELEDLEELYKKNKLKELSKIENTNVQVK
ncbi:MAG: hypothetical protein ORN54_07875 [Cyclobacteriaceae bacterium]|nr:hypothetical protein [Cyclobacteriaceae bacterium]